MISILFGCRPSSLRKREELDPSIVRLGLITGLANWLKIYDFLFYFLSASPPIYTYTYIHINIHIH